MTTSKVSVTKKFKEVVFPELKELGFQQLTTKLYGKNLPGNLFQYILISVSNGIRRGYELTYATTLLSSANDTLNMDIGSKTRKYGAKSEEMLQSSIEKVLIDLDKTIVPFFDSSSSIEKYIEQLTEIELNFLPLYKNGHTELTIACSFLEINDLTNAKVFTCNAINSFQKIYDEKPVCDWALEYRKKSEELLESIEVNKFREILNSWKNDTIAHNKLSKIIN